MYLPGPNRKIFGRSPLYNAKYLKIYTQKINEHSGKIHKHAHTS